MAWDREYDSTKREWIGEGNPNLVGWMIVADGDKRRIKEVKGEHKIFDLAQNDDDHPTTIYWTRKSESYRTKVNESSISNLSEPRCLMYWNGLKPRMNAKIYE